MQVHSARDIKLHVVSGRICHMPCQVLPKILPRNTTAHRPGLAKQNFSQKSKLRPCYNCLHSCDACTAFPALQTLFCLCALDSLRLSASASFVSSVFVPAVVRRVSEVSCLLMGSMQSTTQLM